MKRTLSFAMVIVFIALLSFTAFAAEEQPMLMWTNTSSVRGVIASSNSAYAATIDGKVGTTKIECTMVLYEKGLFGYSEVSRSTQTAYQANKTFTASYTYTSGKTYKLEIISTVTANGTNETVSVSIEQKA